MDQIFVLKLLIEQHTFYQVTCIFINIVYIQVVIKSNKNYFINYFKISVIRLFKL